MKIYLLRKHPKMPYSMRGHLEAFTVEDISTNKNMLKLIAEQKNKKSSYLWTVGMKELKE